MRLWHFDVMYEEDAYYKYKYLRAAQGRNVAKKAEIMIINLC